MDVTFFENQPYYPKVGIQGEKIYPIEVVESQLLELELTEPKLTAEASKPTPEPNENATETAEPTHGPEETTLENVEEIAVETTAPTTETAPENYVRVYSRKSKKGIESCTAPRQNQETSKTLENDVPSGNTAPNSVNVDDINIPIALRKNGENISKEDESSLLPNLTLESEVETETSGDNVETELHSEKNGNVETDGDFILIVLKNLIERQSSEGSSKVKVILMSATVDSSLFSKYFGHCPVVTAEGRTHPVTTYFLEDIYDQINYRLASDSPASLANETFSKGQNLQRASVTNSRGKKNLVLSAWGDESLLSEEHCNPHFVPSYYQSFSEQAQKNLKKVNEDVIDYDLIEDLICYIDESCGEGAILVFLPGVFEINHLHDKLAASYQFGGPSSDWLIPLHSSVASTEQKKVFLRPPGNIRKVVIATNIAETSITIDDVIYVIDCGKHKENRYNPQKKLSSMVEDWISQANARQRQGRAGRVKPGICFRLYTRYRFEKLMRPYQVPEMLRMPLVELCLQIKLLCLGFIKSFLSMALEPPKIEAIDSAMSLLYEVGALEGDEELTPLGHHLAKLPVDVLIGKMMVYGAIFGCLSPILSVSAFLSYKSPFVYPKDERQNVERAKLILLNEKQDGPGDVNDVDKQSDHLLMMIAYKRWETILNEKGGKAAQQFCNSYFLSSPVMFMIREMRIQFGTLLADIGLITLPKFNQVDGKRIGSLDRWLSDVSQPFNMYAHHSSILKAILCAGLYPNVAAGEQGIVATALSSLKRSPSSVNSSRTFWFDGRREVHLHPSSINSNTKVFKHPFLVFLEKVETNKIFLRDTSVISPYSILLFGGSINVQHQTGLVIIDGWLKLNAPAQIAVLFKELRLALHSILKELIRKPENVIVLNDEIIKSIINLLLEEGSVPK
ncbi:hypothetical protein KIW84_040007 [Lathyrus oleraceus]|uniref:RNA helicase n=1 Tax=Pisum sativum TaxID=3888 RepID=A0A9D5AJJ8_PEA|nr:hypothetical protein KIW84_040007 [Pisum sativum]